MSTRRCISVGRVTVFFPPDGPTNVTGSYSWKWSHRSSMRLRIALCDVPGLPSSSRMRSQSSPTSAHITSARSPLRAPSAYRSSATPVGASITSVSSSDTTISNGGILASSTYWSQRFVCFSAIWVGLPVGGLLVGLRGGRPGGGLGCGARSLLGLLRRGRLDGDPPAGAEVRRLRGRLRDPRAGAVRGLQHLPVLVRHEGVS